MGSKMKKMRKVGIHFIKQKLTRQSDLGHSPYTVGTLV